MEDTARRMYEKVATNGRSRSRAPVLGLIAAVFVIAAGLGACAGSEEEENRLIQDVQNAYDTAQKSDAIGPLLRSLVPHAIRVGKRVRSETELGRGTLSVARLGVDLGRRVFGTFEGRKALIVGAGRVAGADRLVESARTGGAARIAGSSPYRSRFRSSCTHWFC